MSLRMMNVTSDVCDRGLHLSLANKNSAMPTVIQINMHGSKSQLSQLAERVWAGDHVVIARAGKLYLDLLPHQP